MLLFCSIAFHAQGQTQVQLDQEVADRLARADAKLNTVYKDLLKSHASDKQYISDLREAQRAWLRFIEYHLKAMFPLKKGESAKEIYGSAHFMDVTTQKAELIEQRIEQLQGK